MSLTPPVSHVLSPRILPSHAVQNNLHAGHQKRRASLADGEYLPFTDERGHSDAQGMRLFVKEAQVGKTAKLRPLMRACVVGAGVVISGMIGGADAQVGAPVIGKIFHSPIPGRMHPAGLWDKPNEACMTHCEVHVDKGCFKRLAEKNPDADPAAIQEQCDEKFSLCLYDCMCDTCDENQIIIRQ